MLELRRTADAASSLRQSGRELHASWRSACRELHPDELRLLLADRRGLTQALELLGLRRARRLRPLGALVERRRGLALALQRGDQPAAGIALRPDRVLERLDAPHEAPGLRRLPLEAAEQLRGLALDVDVRLASHDLHRTGMVATSPDGCATPGRCGPAGRSARTEAEAARREARERPVGVRGGEVVGPGPQRSSEPLLGRPKACADERAVHGEDAQPVILEERHRLGRVATVVLEDEIADSPLGRGSASLPGARPPRVPRCRA